LVESSWLTNLTGARVRLKLESTQVSNSFKSRGAFNAVLARIERLGKPPIQLVTASAGNHGLALAAAAATFGIPLVVYTPSNAPTSKVAPISKYGAQLRAEARGYEEAERLAKEFAADGGGEFISPYNDADVIAGAGTIALELLEDEPGIEVMVVPIGGGGLISGMAAMAKALNPAIEVVGIEAEASCPFLTSRRLGRLERIVPKPTLADGLAGNPDPDTITFSLIQRSVDRIVTVNEGNWLTRSSA